ncbi:hypothetical protein GCM10023215_35570 [Pseudonocardia yuanmonensis]|uniref:Polyketide cyclase / dehydrase and lipid transport n=1 Tax=Pseudonocardia yuanmonensis TaxID=1095914 RepID=A0ABP8WSJ7_9PSEU
MVAPSRAASGSTATARVPPSASAVRAVAAQSSAVNVLRPALDIAGLRTVAYGWFPMVRNVHEREFPAPAEQVWELVAALGGPGDRLWPAAWLPVAFDRPLGPGASGGHGGLRYAVSRYEPGRLVEFTAAPGRSLDGTHAFVVEPRGRDRCVLRHELLLRTTGAMRVLWPLAVRPLHDAVLEDLLDTAERALGTGPARPARWSPLVRVLRLAAERPRATAVPVPVTALLRGALPRGVAAGRRRRRLRRLRARRRADRPAGLGGRGVPPGAGVGRGPARPPSGPGGARRDRAG